MNRRCLLNKSLITSLSANQTNALPDIFLCQDNAIQKNLQNYPKAFAPLDGKVDISDAVLIMQYLSNPEKYPISDKGIDLGDVCNRGDGLTGLDALSIQKYEAHSITSLPESYNTETPEQPVTQTTTVPAPYLGTTTTTTR